MNETAETLRAKPGADLLKLSAGTFVWAETAKGVYRLMVTRESPGLVVVESTVLPLRAGRPMRLIMERSLYDDRGEIFVMHWVAPGLRMLFRGDRGSFRTNTVESASVEAYDGSWKYEL